MNWDAVAAAAPDVDLVAPDLRGRGLSADLPGPAGLHVHADDCAALLDALGLERVVVAGHSMGGLAAVVFADDYPQHVERLVLVDGGLPLHAPPGLTAEQTMAATLGPSAARLAMTFPSRMAYLDFWRAHPAFGARLDEHMAAFLNYDLRPAPGGYVSRVRLDAVRDDVVSQLAPDVLPPALARLRVPAQFLHAPRGFFDDPHLLYPDHEVLEWRRRLPLLRVTEVPDVNHYSIMFKPWAVALIADALRGRL